MIDVKVNDERVNIHGEGTEVELAIDSLRIIRAIYDDLLKCNMKAASRYRSIIMKMIEDIIPLEKLEVKTDGVQKP